jgi:hypothetical protein
MELNGMASEPAEATHILLDSIRTEEMMQFQ